MDDSYDTEPKDPEYEHWFRRQVQIGIDDADAGHLIPSEEVEAEFATLRAASRMKLRRLAL
jgi:predicted transcriptional regulator